MSEVHSIGDMLIKELRVRRGYNAQLTKLKQHTARIDIAQTNSHIPVITTIVIYITEDDIKMYHSGGTASVIYYDYESPTLVEDIQAVVDTHIDTWS